MLVPLVFVEKTYCAETGLHEFEVPYACDQCGFATTAVVTCAGRGFSNSVYGAGGSTEHATWEAEQNAGQNAVTLVQGAPCPVCRRFSRSSCGAFARARLARRRNKLTAVALGIVGSAAGSSVGVLMATFVGAGNGLLWAGAAISAALTMAILWATKTVHVPWIGAGPEVRFWVPVPHRQDRLVSAADLRPEWPDPVPPPLPRRWSWAAVGLGILGGVLASTAYLGVTRMPHSDAIRHDSRPSR